MTDHVFTPPELTRHPGFWRRAIAFLIDGFVIGITSTIVCLIVSAAGINGIYASNGISSVNFFFGILYFALLESSSLQATLGKLMLGMTVTDMNGDRISFLKAAGRYLGMIVSFITLYIGFLMCIWTKNKQCLHDKMAGCLVYTK